MPTCPIEFLFLGAIGDIDYVARPSFDLRLESGRRLGEADV